ncbi:rod shape-determining protein MreC [Anoxynatronum buryatiense]|uniref:Cell shape-determining protein MreC n=1 Tax=Anoxynatronum buryatiense TaxID=489973 RepID=A0AA46AIG7_9CLOT|nr:rod shape-determining protein MreC [Anoxynatronum buryatiense]
MVNELINLNDKNHVPIILTIVVIVLIMIIGFTSHQREQIFILERGLGNVFLPIQRMISKGMSQVEESLVTLIRSSDIKDENNQLRAINESLQHQLIELQLTQEELSELQQLQRTLNSIDRRDDFFPVTANVIAKNPGNWFEMFTIDAGSQQGVEKDSVVIGSGGLVGRVYETGHFWSKVIAIIDNSSSVSFQVLRDGSLQGIISGSVTNELSGYLFDPDAEVVVGDQLITSGIGLYPKGILIGEVTTIDRTPDLLLKSVNVEPAVNFNRLDKVLVISPRTIDE